MNTNYISRAGKTLFVRFSLAIAILLAGFSIFDLTGGAGLAAPPAGGEILFQSAVDKRKSSDADIYTINPDGSGKRRILGGKTNDYGAVWSPSGTQIAFISNRAYTPNFGDEIYVMNAGGTNIRRLTFSNSGAEAASPLNMLWSPDGTKIAYTSNSDPYLPFVVKIVSLDANTPIQTINNQNARIIAWIDSTHLLVHSITQGGIIGTLGIYDYNSGTLTTLHYGREYREPVLSPDKTTVAYVSRDTELGDDDIWTVNLATGAETKLPANTSDYETSPLWSPDGSILLYESFTIGNSAVLYVMNADGSNRRQIAGTNGFYSPIWSPDGTRILFHLTSSAGAGDIFTVNINGTPAVTELTRSKQEEDFATFWK